MDKMYTKPDGTLRMGKIVMHSIVFLILLGVFLGSFGTIDAGYRGVRTRFGAVTGTIDSGLYFKLPLIEHVYTMNVQTQKEQVEAQAASSDLQNVSATVALNYSLMPDKAADVYKNIGVDYKSRIVDPAIQEAVKAATAKYTAEELITKRQIVRDNMRALLTARLENEHIVVTEVSIVNFDFSQSFNAAIEAKVTAEQTALAAKNKLEQVKFEAEQRVAQAKAEAEAIRIQAQAITQQGGAEYVNLKAVEKWDGKLPQYMLGGGATPFINLNK